MAGHCPDGSWFAFSGGPVEASTARNLYAWSVGAQRAVALSADHGSLFASWVGNQMVGSRAAAAEVQPPSPEASQPIDQSGLPVPTPTPSPTPLPTTSPSPTASVDAAVDASASPEPAPIPEFAAE